MEIGQNFTKWCKTLNSKANFNIFGTFWECTSGIGYFIPSKMTFLNAQSWALSVISAKSLNWNAMLGVNLRASDPAQIFLGFSKVVKPQFLGASWKFECWGFLDTPNATSCRALLLALGLPALVFLVLVLLALVLPAPVLPVPVLLLQILWC